MKPPVLNRSPAAVGAAAALLAIVAPVLADTGERTLSLPAQALQKSLIEVGERYDIGVMARDDLIGDRAAPAISGTIGALEAVRTLLAGTGLAARELSNGSIVVEMGPSQQDEAVRAPADAESREPVAIEELVIFGERVARRLEETLSSVSVLSAEDVARRAQQDVFESLVGVPNTVYLDGSSLPAIRGQDNNSGAGSSLGNSALSGVEPRSLLIVDDFARTPSWANGAFTSLFDVDQVEVFRGPQSTLRGRNAISGAFIVKTRDPTFEVEGTSLLETTYSDPTKLGYRVGAAISGPLVGEQLAGRLAAQYQLDHDPIAGFLPGQYTGSDPDKAREKDTLAVRGKLLWEPRAIPELRAVLSGDYVEFTSSLFQNSIAGPGVDPSITFDDRLQAFGGDYRVVDGTSYFTGLNAAYELNDTGSFELLLSYGDDTFVTNEALNSSAVTFDDAANTVFTAEGLWRFQFGEDFLSGILGASYARRTTFYDAGFDGPFGFVPLVIDDETDTYAIYTDVRIQATERLEFNVGGRVLDTSQTRNFLFGAPAIVDEKFDDDAILPQLGLLYDLSATQTLGLSLRRGYGDGGRSFNNVRFNSYEFDPESVWTLEGLYRYSSADGRLSFNATAFYNRYEDQQFTVIVTTDPFPVGEIRNQPESRSYGLEFEVVFAPLDNLDLRAAIGLLETEVTEVSNEALNVEEGASFGLDPGYTVNLGVDWRVLPALSLYGDVSFIDEYFNDVANTPGATGGDYSLTNVGARYEAGQFTLRCFVQNVTDELAFATRTDDRFGLLALPRTFGVSLSADF